MIAVEITSLGRIYEPRGNSPQIIALNDVSLAIEEGEIHGLLGPNGAGKTTLVKVLSTVLLPTSGTASILGHDVVTETQAVRPLIGLVLGGDRGFYRLLTGRQNLEYWAALYKVPSSTAKGRVSDLLEMVSLVDRADYLFETYSRGMKQRLHLARGLVGDAKVLFLDEPTTGLDPIAARQFQSLVMTLKTEGRTVLLTTHDMAEAEAVCDRVTLIDRGKILAVETPRSLSTLVAQFERIEFDGGPDGLVDSLPSIPGVATVSSLQEGGYRIELDDESSTSSVLEMLVAAGVTSLRTTRPSLEEVYIRVVGDR